MKSHKKSKKNKKYQRKKKTTTNRNSINIRINGGGGGERVSSRVVSSAPSGLSSDYYNLHRAYEQSLKSSNFLPKGPSSPPPPPSKPPSGPPPPPGISPVSSFGVLSTPPSKPKKVTFSGASSFSRASPLVSPETENPKDASFGLSRGVDTEFLSGGATSSPMMIRVREVVRGVEDKIGKKVGSDRFTKPKISVKEKELKSTSSFGFPEKELESTSSSVYTTPAKGGPDYHTSYLHRSRFESGGTTRTGIDSFHQNGLPTGRTIPYGGTISAKKEGIETSEGKVSIIKYFLYASNFFILGNYSFNKFIWRRRSRLLRLKTFLQTKTMLACMIYFVPLTKIKTTFLKLKAEGTII